MVFNKRLREARIANKMTQRVASDSLGIALRSYQCYETGSRRPAFELLVQIADLFNVSLDWLLGRDSFLEASADVPPEDLPKSPRS